MAVTGFARREVVPGVEVVLDHRQHERRRADLEERGDLGQVGVADDDVQAAVLLRVAVRLVPGVDDRALERRLEPDLLLEEVGSLAQLEMRRPIRLAVLLADLAGAGEDLASDEVRRQPLRRSARRGVARSTR